MAWKEVTVKKGNSTDSGFMRGDDLDLPNKIGKPESVNVDGKTIKVVSFWVDERDNIIKIKLDVPMGTPTKKGGESNGKSDEGSNKT